MTTLPNYPAAAALQNDDLLALWQDGQQRSVTVSQLLGAVVSIRVQVTAIEAITAGSFVNISGQNVRFALASDPELFATGYVLNDIAVGESSHAYAFGLNTALTIGAASPEVWLSSVTPGGFTSDPPTAPGHIIQPLGPAIPGQGVLFFPQARTILS